MPDPIVYVSVPQGDRTGGPECMHQFADALIRRGIRTIMVPMRNFRGRTPDSEYDVYQYEVAEEISNPDNAILVIGEVSPIESHRELRQVPSAPYLALVAERAQQSRPTGPVLPRQRELLRHDRTP